MKNRLLWSIQIPVIFAFAGAYLIVEQGKRGDLQNRFLRENIYQPLRRISTSITDFKFRARGVTEPKNKVVIVEIDSPSLDAYGRWPWHRDTTAFLIQKVFEAGAKVVGLDIAFSEKDIRVPDQLKEALANSPFAPLAQASETDPVMTHVIEANASKLVTGWLSESICQPAYYTADECPVANPDAIATHPVNFEKFAAKHLELPANFDPMKTPMSTFATVIANLDEYNQVAKYSGSVNVDPDADGHVRRTNPIIFGNRKAYPSLAFGMALAGLQEELVVKIDEEHKLRRLAFAKSGQTFPANELGVLEINFRGGRQTFPYVSATELFSEEDTLKDELNRKLAGVKKSEVLKDAYVLIGLTALGVYDMRAFPFDSNVAGVEGHATILDNVLSGDFLRPGGGAQGKYWVLGLMTLFAAVFGFATQRLESIPALLMFLSVFSGLVFVDTKIFFARNVNWESGLLYVELLCIFVFTLAAKYVLEERNKKFVRSAFSKYVAPAVVDAILKDPTKLTVGGQKRELTIMFSDIRSFTTFSERLDAKMLSSFLNDYLGIMTEIVFAHGGTLDKYIGDAIMAFWGAPLDQPQHAANACRATIQMMRALDQNKKRFMDQYGVDVNIGIGINSGVVSVGNMGSANNFSYTVIGDHVNLSSRLEGLTKEYGVTVLTTRFTFDDIAKNSGEVPPHRVLDSVKVKGKNNAVELIQITNDWLPKDGMEIFQDARRLYGEQKWDEAKARFAQAGEVFAKANGGQADAPCELFQERCDYFKAEPPEAGWDGAWVMKTK